MSTVQGRAAARLYTGSALVAKRLGGWFVPKDRPVAATIRCGGALWAGTHFGPGLLDHGPLLAAASACWCWTAWRAKPTKEAEEDPAEEEPEEESSDQFTTLRQAVTHRLQQWIGDRPGIHLAEVYERYRQLPRHGHLTDPEIRAAIDHYRIPVRRAVRDPRNTVQPVRAGIHRDDLQPLPSPESAASVADPVAAGVTSDVAA